MSEYQYYEFLAIDRPLTEDEMAELRALSTRATSHPSVSPTNTIGAISRAIRIS